MRKRLSTPTLRQLTTGGAAALMALTIGLPVLAQFGDNPVYVDDSPRAWELFRRAADQVRDNPGEAARLYQEVLDQYALKLIPVAVGASDHFASARHRVNDSIRADSQLLERYRAIETPRAERLLDAGQFDFLIETRYLTAPALEAHLHLAQRDVESARFHTAIRRLQDLADHPDLTGRRAAHRWFLLGLAAHHVDDTETRGEALAALRAGVDPLDRNLHDELARLLEQGPGPDVVRGLTILDRAPEANAEAIVTTPIWDVPLSETIVNQVYQTGNRPPSQTALDNARDNGTWLGAAPTLAGHTVLINEGFHVRAFDRFSQRQLWERQVSTPPSITRQGTRTIGDLNIVAVEGNAVVTITGFASDRTARQGGEVVRLNRDTGAIEWRVDLGRVLDREEYGGIYPYGAPIIADGSVFVLARRQSGQSLISGYIVALDLHDNGHVRWVRYIASCGGLQNNTTRPYASLAWHGRDLYVASALGATARIAPTSGEIVWLTRREVPLRPANMQPWTMSSPVVTQAGVFVIAPDETAVLQIDRGTGTVLAEFRARTWGSPQYLLASDDMIFGVGNGDVVGVVANDPLEPIWKLTESGVNLGFDDLRGRVHLAGNTLVVPTSDELLIVNGSFGTIERRIPMEGASNPLLSGAELFVAQTDRLAAYVPLNVAEAMLRQQMTENPADPEPALSLLRLAAHRDDRAQAIDLSLEAARYAGDAIGRMPAVPARETAQDQLFELLVATAAMTEGLDYDRGAALHGRIGAAAATVPQRIEHLLSLGEWLTAEARTNDRAYLADAIEAYQTILSDDVLAGAHRERDGVIEPAAAVASDRIAAVISEFGMDVYAPLATEAERRVAAMGRAATTDQLRAIFVTYPFASAAREAARTSAERLARDDPRQAYLILRSLAQSATDDLAKRSDLGRLIALAIKEDWPQLATAWLRAARDDMGYESLPDAAGIERPLVEWFSNASRLELTRNQPTSIRSIDADPNEFLPTLDGRLLATDAAVGRLPSEFALIQNANEIIRIDAADLEEKWSADVAEGAATLIGLSPDRILLHHADVSEFSALDPDSGVTTWRERVDRTRLTTLSEPNRILPAGGTAISVPGANQRHDPYEVLPMVIGNSVFLVGRVVGAMHYDLAAPGGRLDWARDHPLDAVHYAGGHELGIVLAGQRYDNDSRAPVGRVVVLDPSTGDTRAELSTYGDALVEWMVVSPLGVAVIGTDVSIEAIDLAAGTIRWINVSSDAGWMSRGWVVDREVLAAEVATSLHRVDLETGRLDREFRPAADRTGQPSRLEGIANAEPRIIARYRERVVAFNRDGTIHGQDIISQDRNYTHLLVGQNGFAVVSHVTNPDPGQRGRNRRFVDIVYVFSESCKLLDSAAVPADRSELFGAVAIDGWLLLSGQRETVAIPIK